MLKQAGLLLLPMLMMVFSCHRHETAIPAPTLPVIEKSDISGIFNNPVIVFIYPDETQTRNLKRDKGIDYFYALSDNAGAEYTKTRQLAEKQKIDVWSGTTGKYRFITHDGTIIDIDLGSSSQPWKQIIFNGRDAPSISDPSDARKLIANAFHLNTGRKEKKSEFIASFEYPTESQITKPDERSDEVDHIPAIKEPTIRLSIFPGQVPPPLRYESNGIHIVNSFISPGHRLWFEFDNDMFSNTDRYYTNGIVLGYTAPGLTSWRINRLMIRHNRNSVVHSSISLHHGMFTPLTTKEPPPLIYDRPYASTLYLRYSQTSEDALAGFRLSSAIEAGVIGEAALGQLLQRSVHAGIPSNDEPQGWETQIKNDLVLNYHVNIQKQIVRGRNTEVYAAGDVKAGTLHTGAAMGVNFVTGIHKPGLTPLPLDYEQFSAKTGEWQYGFRGGLELRMIGYDASLQGGMFNRNNIYALKPDELERLVAAIHLGLFLDYRELGISITQFYLSPEFKEGREHFWGQIGLQAGW